MLCIVCDEMLMEFCHLSIDGPTIQMASHEALQKGMTFMKVFDTIKEARQQGVKVRNLDVFLLPFYFDIQLKRIRLVMGPFRYPL